MTPHPAVGVILAFGLGMAWLGCDDSAERAARENALRAQPPIQSGSLNQAMGAERLMPKLPTPQDRLMLAVRGGDRDEAARWLQKGATIEGGHAIMVAGVRSDGGLAFVEWLGSRGAPTDEADGAGRTPLSWAASEGALEEVSFFLERGAGLDQVDTLGRTPLHYGVFSGNAAVVKALLTAQAEVNAQDNLGSTPLMYACAKNLEDTVAALLGAGADPLLLDKLGRTAAERAHGANNPCHVERASEP